MSGENYQALQPLGDVELALVCRLSDSSGELALQSEQVAVALAVRAELHFRNVVVLGGGSADHQAGAGYSAAAVNTCACAASEAAPSGPVQ
jgi:hypothetical protein